MEITKKKLKELYIDKGLTQKEIAKIYKVSRRTIGRRMESHNVKTRREEITKEMLKDLYYRKGLSHEKIAKKLNRDRATISYYMDKLDIKTKERGPESFGINREILIDMYENKKYNYEEIAHLIGVTKGTIHGWFKIFDIEPKTKIKDSDDFQNKLDKISDSKEYIFLEKFNGAYEKIKVKHKKCGTIWKVKPYEFIFKARRCLCNNMSSGERIIKHYLDENDHKYNQEVRFEDCRNINPLSFDFQIFLKEGEYILCEYDGQQHFEIREKNNLYGGEETLKETKKRDKIKNNFCKKNNIQLIRIPYWEKKNIELILSQALKDTGQFTIFNVC